MTTASSSLRPARARSSAHAGVASGRSAAETSPLSRSTHAAGGDRDRSGVRRPPRTRSSSPRPSPPPPTGTVTDSAVELGHGASLARSGATGSCAAVLAAVAVTGCRRRLAVGRTDAVPRSAASVARGSSNRALGSLEADLRMCPVAERLRGGRPAAAEGDRTSACGVMLLPVGVKHSDRSSDDVGAVLRRGDGHVVISHVNALPAREWHNPPGPRHAPRITSRSGTPRPTDPEEPPRSS